MTLSVTSPAVRVSRTAELSCEADRLEVRSSEGEGGREGRRPVAYRSDPPRHSPGGPLCGPIDLSRFTGEVDALGEVT